MQDYKDYEGRCKYCGHTELILSESQEQADENVTRKCMCDGREREDRRNKLTQAINDISKADEYLNLKGLVHRIGDMVLDEIIEKASITVQGSTITIKGGAKIRVQRNAKTTALMEI